MSQQACIQISDQSQSFYGRTYKPYACAIKNGFVHAAIDHFHSAEEWKGVERGWGVVSGLRWKKGGTGGRERGVGEKRVQTKQDQFHFNALFVLYQLVNVLSTDDSPVKKAGQSSQPIPTGTSLGRPSGRSRPAPVMITILILLATAIRTIEGLSPHDR